MLLYAPIYGVILYVGFLGRNLLAPDDKLISPGQFLVAGLALLVLYHLLFDIGYAIWLRSGKGIYSKGHFERAWGLLGLGLFALPLWIGFRRQSLPLGWRRVVLVGAIITAFLACVGLLETISYILVTVNSRYFFESWEIIGLPVIAGIGNLGLFGWACGCHSLCSRLLEKDPL
jgi:hypothetical protein